MNLKEFNELQERYKRLKGYKDKNINLLRSISNDLEILYNKLDEISNEKFKENCQDQIRLCWTSLELLRDYLIRNKDVDIIIQTELTRLENIDLTIKPLTLEVRKDD